MLIKSYFKINIRKIGYINARIYSKLSQLTELHEKYDPIILDGCCIDYWKSCYKNDYDNLFTVIMPPPNVTGNLHIGHALSFSLQDTIIRSKKMMGYNTMWVPGYDHAGIATQVQVEKRLQKQHGKKWNSNMINKEDFVEICTDWSQKRMANISCQIKSLGLNPNFEEEYFTLNKKHSQVVNQAFIELYHRNKIYRDNRIINWSCRLQSAISDIEIDWMEIKEETNVNVPDYKKPIKFGAIHKIAYKFENNNDKEMIVATTRPETIPADSCLAVHPNDSRYSGFVGLNVINPVTGSIIPIISDAQVDPAFETGVLKVTPGHSLVDFNIGKEHNLTWINIFDNRGNFENVTCLNLLGVPRFIGREIIIDHLVKNSLYRGCNRNYSMKLPICSRSSDIVEYLIRPQWFYDISESSDKIIQIINNGGIEIQPSNYTGSFLQYLEAKEPWCISRQLKWGHPIPINFYRNGEVYQEFVGMSNEDIIKQNASLDKNKLQPDIDVLDTWFSSSLIPLSLGGWPNNLNKKFPSSLLVTGHDIVPLWVCRMMLMSMELVNHLPFQHVLLHGMICDKTGQKMSKSKGNVIDPMELVGKQVFDKLIYDSGVANAKDDFVSDSISAITNMGSDAVRISLLEYYISGHQINFDITKVKSARNFMQKMWQTLRYVYYKWNEEEIAHTRCANLHDGWNQLEDRINSLNNMQKWLLFQLGKLVVVAFDTQSSLIYHPLCVTVREVWWNDLCSVFIEWSKAEKCPIQRQLNLEIIMLTINTCLHVMHPITPQITEILWHCLLKDQVNNKSLSNEKYPSFDMVKNFNSPDFHTSESFIKECLENVSEINYLTKIFKLSRTKLQSLQVAWLRVEGNNEKKEIISRLTGVPISTETSGESYFSIYINDSIIFEINKQFGDLSTIESYIISKLKQFQITKQQLIDKKQLSDKDEELLSNQLINIESSIKLYDQNLRFLRMQDNGIEMIIK